MAHIQLQSVTKRYGGKVALDGVELSMASQVFTAVLGPPGAGKTTLLRVVAGLEAVEKGTIRFDGRDVTHLSPAERRVSYVAQEFALYPHMNVFQNIAYPLRLRRLPRAEITERVHRAAAFLRIDKLLDRSPATLSGGEQQRVAIARGLVKDADVYLFDEPLTNLDYKIREDMRSELRRIQKEMGRTVVYATPDPVEALSMSEAVVLLNQGHVEEAGLTAEVYRAPGRLFSARYFGYPQANVLAARVRRDGARAVLEGGFFSLSVEDGGAAGAGDPPGAAVAVVLRPEHLRLSRERPATPLAIACEVVLAEIIGSDTIVHLRPSGQELLLRAFVPRTVRPRSGEQLWAGVAAADIMVYDPRTQALVWKGDGDGTHPA